MSRSLSPLPNFEEGGPVTLVEYSKVAHAYQLAKAAAEAEDHHANLHEIARREARARQKHYEDLLLQLDGQLTIDSALEET